MSYKTRKELIHQIEQLRNSKIITLITSDRYSTMPIQGIQAQIASDQVSQIINHLQKLDKTKDDSLDLFIYSRGGDVNTAWPLVNTIRNYFKKFNILIPVHAHSSATLISLGADKIVMSKTASLSPIDPTVANPFNPRENNQALGISVEDVAAFFSLAKDKDNVGINSEDNITQVFNILSKKVHPLALGNVKRSHSQIRLLAKKLLTLHPSTQLLPEKIDPIINELTEKFFTHNHSIFREEAKQTGLDGIIVDSTEEEESLFWSLYQDYEKEMQLKEFFDPNCFLGTANERLLETTPVMIESTVCSSKFLFKQMIKKALPPIPELRLNILAQNNQTTKNAQALKTQLFQIQTNLLQHISQLTAIAQQNPTAIAFNGLINDGNVINQQITNILSAITEELNLDILKTQIEFTLQFLGWVDENI